MIRNHLRVAGWIGVGCVLGAWIVAPLHAQQAPKIAAAPTSQTRVAPHSARAFSSDAQKFSFAILGDRTHGSPENWPITDRAVAEINLLRPDLVISVGDLQQGYAADESDAPGETGGGTDGEIGGEAVALQKQWAEYRQHLAPLQMPYYYVPGNHDIYNRTSYDHWRKNVGATYYSFDYKGCHFLVLDTQEARGLAATGEKGKDGITPAQIEWVRRDIAALKNTRHVFVFMHKPFFRDPGQPLQEWLQIQRILQDRPYTVFAGHIHQLAQMEVRDGHRYFILGATGARNGVRDSSTFAPNGRFQHYAVVNVDGNDARVSIVEVGHIFPQDISRAVATSKRSLTNLVRVTAGPLRFEGEAANATLTLQVQNTLNTPIDVRFSWQQNEKHLWQISPFTAPLETVAPGKTRTQTFAARFDTKALSALPSFHYTVTAQGQSIADVIAPLQMPGLQRKVRSWHIIGPFALEDPNAVYPPEREIDLTKSYAGKPGRTRQGAPQTVQWQPLLTNSDGIVRPRFDVEKSDHFENDQFAVAYAMARVTAPTARNVLATLGTLESDDGAKIWVNGQVAGEIEGGSDRPQSATFPVSLRAGENIILVKTKQRINDWGFGLQLLDLRNDLALEGPRHAELPEVADEE